MAPHCSQKLHIVLSPFVPGEHATRSFGIWEQFEPWCVNELAGWSNPTGGDLGAGEAREA